MKGINGIKRNRIERAVSRDTMRTVDVQSEEVYDKAHEHLCPADL
jgi:hypothetical protein